MKNRKGGVQNDPIYNIIYYVSNFVSMRYDYHDCGRCNGIAGIWRCDYILYNCVVHCTTVFEKKEKMMGESYTDSSFFLRCIIISFNERTLRRILLCIRETNKDIWRPKYGYSRIWCFGRKMYMRLKRFEMKSMVWEENSKS